MLVPLFSATAQHNNVIENKDNVTIARADSLNSGSGEANISISPDGKNIFFMSNRGGKRWSRYIKTDDGRTRADGDIYYSIRINGIWQKAHSLSDTINTGEGQDEPLVLPDGKYVVYESWAHGWQFNGGPYYKAEMNGKTWTNSVGLGGGINPFFVKQYNMTGITATDGMCISPDGTTFIVASGTDYEAPMDLYISKKINDTWGCPVKMSISTDKNERSVFISADGETLFFASDGYPGLGGLDIFEVTLNKDGSCGKPVNLGKPYNSEGDDYGFLMTPGSEEAWFVREGDIYAANFPATDSVLFSEPTSIKDTTVESKSDTVASVDKILQTPGIVDFMLIVNFGYRQSNIGEKYYAGLNEVVDTLKKYPLLRIEIFGHTDSRGPAKGNLVLSQKRANAVSDYFISHGIAVDRMDIRSYGDSKLLVPDAGGTREAEAAKNRRCEITYKK
ncbi:MAG: OmpA family protein [Bacteroidota bacterium]